MLAAGDPAQLANLERYLLELVGPHFRATGNLAADDLWLVLIWKANRAKNSERRRYERIGRCTFNEAVRRIAEGLHAAPTHQARLKLLMHDWRLRLPTATAVLTILYPQHFTVYDVRLCNQLGGFHELASRRYSQGLWDAYGCFIDAAVRSAPAGLTLREMDHYHWGSSLRAEVTSELSGPVPARNKRRTGASP